MKDVVGHVRGATRALPEPFTVADVHAALGGAQMVSYDAVGKALSVLAARGELAKRLVRGSPRAKRFCGSTYTGLYVRTPRLGYDLEAPPPNPLSPAALDLLQKIALRWDAQRHASAAD